MKLSRSKRGVVVLGVLLLALFLVRPGANRLRTRIVSSISLALGHPVDVASVHLRLLPRPGFDLENFVVHDDPAFSAEPMLQAHEVTASLRLISLLRGRLEIARLSLTEPSLNLVRSSEGHWNLENLVERAARIPIAPTSKAKSEKRPGFPYIEADRGRINFKSGPEKKPYALTEADFALWQDSENTWGVRLKAQPVRTDFNLTDTGVIRVNGTWQRAATLPETPVQFTLQWDRVQLGQMTKLVSGNDLGWRGTIRLSAELAGTPSDLRLETEAHAEDFRRYNVLGGGPLRLAAQCGGQYSSLDHKLSNISCRAPVGVGLITIDGSILNPFGARGYELAVKAHGLPIQSLVALAQHTKQNLPNDLTAEGQLDANVKLSRLANVNLGVAMWTGTGETSGFRLASRLANTELVLDKIPIALSPSNSQTRAGQALSHANLEIGPFNLALGKPAPTVVRGSISRSGYSFSIGGDGLVQRFLQLARTVGISALQPVAEGSAKVELQVAGDWSTAPRATGKAQLHSVHAEIRGLNAPLEIASASLVFSPDQTSAQNINASLADTSWHGSVLLPRPCVSPATCAVHFDLHADEISIDQLNRVFNPHASSLPWYRFLSSSPTGTPLFLMLHATGRLGTNRLLVRKLTATRVSASIELKDGKLRAADLRGDFLGGKHNGEWKADFTAKPPQYSGTGSLDGIVLDQLAEAMNDGWITGSGGATYRVTTSGLNASELFASAVSTLEVEAHDGLLPHIALIDASGPLHVRTLVARLFLRDGKFEIQQSKLETPNGIYQVSGTASLGRILNVKLARDGARGFDLTGTLAEPHVTVASETQAALKP